MPTLFSKWIPSNFLVFWAKVSLCSSGCLDLTVYSRLSSHLWRSSCTTSSWIPPNCKDAVCSFRIIYKFHLFFFSQYQGSNSWQFHFSLLLSFTLRSDLMVYTFISWFSWHWSLLKGPSSHILFCINSFLSPSLPFLSFFFSCYFFVVSNHGKELFHWLEICFPRGF